MILHRKELYSLAVAIVNESYLKQLSSKKMRNYSLILSFLLALSALPASDSSVAHERISQKRFEKPGSEMQSTPRRTPFALRHEVKPPAAKQWTCLPKDVQADEVVSYTRGGKQNVTVGTKLVEIKARCRRGKLLDAKNREIRFFRTACWGNPPADYQEIRQQESDELAKLKKRYTVIVFGCDPRIQ